MKTILIERVSNGWIVRPFAPNPGWASCGPDDRSDLAVYTRMEDLQADLPKFFAETPVKDSA